MLMASSGQAQNLFVTAGYTGPGTVYEYTPNGVQSTFGSGLNAPTGLAFNSAGDLFVAQYNLENNIVEYTPGGAQSTFASGLSAPFGLAFNSAGNLFVADDGSGNIYAFTPDGAQSTFASGLPYPEFIAFQGETLPVPEPSVMALLAVGVTALLVRRRR
jgi:DNA-binding beta-propeller fold protein YncE